MYLIEVLTSVDIKQISVFESQVDLNQQKRSQPGIIIIIIIITMICLAQIPYNVQMRFTIKLHSPKIGYNN